MLIIRLCRSWDLITAHTELRQTGKQCRQYHEYTAKKKFSHFSPSFFPAAGNNPAVVPSYNIKDHGGKLTHWEVKRIFHLFPKIPSVMKWFQTEPKHWDKTTRTVLQHSLAWTRPMSNCNNSATSFCFAPLTRGSSCWMNPWTTRHK